MNLGQKLKHYFFDTRWRFSRFQFNLVAVFFIFLGLTGGFYLALSKIFPNVFALNDTHQTWTFNTANVSSYAYNSNLMTVDNTGAYPVANKLSNPAFASDNSSWSVGAVAPTGWVAVAGNSTYSTNEFLMMKYDAKCASTGNLAVGLTDRVSSDGTTYHVYSDANSACTSANSKQVVSVASGDPITDISQTNSITRCSAVAINGNAAHLITNNEWMTVARDAEAQASNWTGGSVGSGYLYAGHNDNSPATALPASTTDTGNYACAYTDATGLVENPSPCPTSISNSSSTGNQKRVFTLSNGSYIWDIGGNVRKWTNNTILGKDQPTGSTPGFAWREFTALTTYGTLAYNDIRPLGSTYNSTQGMGQIYSDGTSTNNTSYAVLRGGNWNYGSLAGAFTAYLISTPGSTSYVIGFRCASDPVAISQSFSSSSGRGATGVDIITVGTIANAKIYQSVNVGDTAVYDYSVYVYNNTAGGVGGTITSSIAQLFDNGTTIPTTYTDAGSGWWKLAGTVTGVNSSVQYGVLIKAGKTVMVDDFTLNKQATYSVYTTSGYSNNAVTSWDTFCEGTLVGSVCTPDATHSGYGTISYQICLGDGSSCESGSSWEYYDGSNWQTATNTTTNVNTPAQLTQAAMQKLSIASQKISVKAIFSYGGSDVPKLPHISIGLTTDTTPPTVNASAISMSRSNGGTGVNSNGWTNNVAPYFSWTAGADNGGGTGLKGYCLYLGTDANGDPTTSKGLLGTSPVVTAGTTCQFIVSATSIDLATAAYRGSPWLTTSNSPYYLNVKAVDNSGNVFTGSAAQFQFRFDNTPPTNVSYLSCASGSFSNVADMNFSWPTSGSVASADANVGVLGWQYQINSTSGTWLGDTTEVTVGVNNYMPISESARNLTQTQDGSHISSGNNVVYFRTVDAAGNVSADATIRTCNLSYGGAAPAFSGTDSVTVTPSSTTDNSYALSWPAATATSGKNIKHYYYMINTAPPSTLATLLGNAATYIDNGTSMTVATNALPGVNKGTNTVYVVAIDDATVPNYSPSNYITGTFTLNSTDPDNPDNLVSSDSSIKSQSQWNVTLTWTAPIYKGAGNLTYLIYRSTDGKTFAQTGSTLGLSYVDNTPSSTLYYYKVYAKDGANAVSSGTNAITITPTGKWISSPNLSSGPSVDSISVRKATITWSTDRGSDSKVEYGTGSNSYNDVEPSNSSQVTSHSIQLTGLNPGTTYYYRAKWTDEDGNTGTSDENSFTTNSAPNVQDVKTTSIALTSALLTFTSNGASSVKIYYGTSTSFGGAVTLSTSTASTTYSSQLTGLLDGTKYYYKINTFDNDGTEYDGTVLDFTTLPRPKISNVRIQQVSNTAQSTILVSWTTNTEVSSIVTYYPQGDTAAARDEVNVALTKGEHQLIVRGLLPQTDYILVVKGRDKIGNEASSDSQRLTTALDTRPPEISDLSVEGSAIPPTTSTAQISTAQLVVAWNTDEPATSQVEYGEGTGTDYSMKTQQDTNLTFNHLVIISNLTPSKVYHLRSISNDKAGNIASSIDTVTITPKATDNALNLVITNLQAVFGFIGNLKQ
jgi:hypothetical protein